MSGCRSPSSSRSRLLRDGASISTPRRFAQITEGRSYMRGRSAGRSHEGSANAGKLHATTDFNELAGCRCHQRLCTERRSPKKTADPDFSFMVAAVEEIRKRLRAGSSWSWARPPTPARHTNSSCRCSRRRVCTWARTSRWLRARAHRSANKNFKVRNVPKWSAARRRSAPSSRERRRAGLRHRIAVSSTQAAEMVKLLENTFRH